MLIVAVFFFPWVELVFLDGSLKGNGTNKCHSLCLKASQLKIRVRVIIWICGLLSPLSLSWFVIYSFLYINLLSIHANAWQKPRFLQDEVGASLSPSLSFSLCLSLSLAAASALLAGLTRIKTPTPDTEEKNCKVIHRSSLCSLHKLLCASFFTPKSTVPLLLR